ncbi:hypothetical protein KC368_g94 [Hortaea werneckii]|nr:hypothetical protein KC368_g94 [Hortaea werneckii]
MSTGSRIHSSLRHRNGSSRGAFAFRSAVNHGPLRSLHRGIICSTEVLFHRDHNMLVDFQCGLFGHESGVSMRPKRWCHSRGCSTGNRSRSKDHTTGNIVTAVKNVSAIALRKHGEMGDLPTMLTVTSRMYQAKYS